MSTTSRMQLLGSRGPLPMKSMRVAEWILGQIDSGRFAPGATLPDRTWFCRRFGVNPSLVQGVFNELKADGFVVATPGHGTRLANRLPSEGRYLLLLKSRSSDAGCRIFAPALKTAAAEVARSRPGVRFTFRDCLDADVTSSAYARVYDSVRRHLYAGVVAQGDSELHGEDTLLNLNGVPMTLFTEKSHFSRGSGVVEFDGMGRFHDVVRERHFEECRAAGAKRIALFLPRTSDEGAGHCAELARRYGLEIVGNGYHSLDTMLWDVPQVKRFMSLFVASDAGRAAEAVVLEDDNMLAPFAEACRRARRRYVVSCHANFPCPPENDIGARFHGLDLPAMISGFVDYAEALRRPGANPPPPRLVVR